MMKYGLVLGLFVLGLGFGEASYGQDVRVAVASNFVPTLRSIAVNFEQAQGHRVIVIPGSTGKLYAQIQHGAPFDVFFSADRDRPALLEKAGLAVPGSRFTYAMGRVALWSADPSLIKGDGNVVLSSGNYRYLAIANPKTAPYGRAAVQILQAVNLWDAVQPRLVQGENIGQAFQFVASGNAELGLVALSSVLGTQSAEAGSRWDVPQALYDPIEQQAVLLTRASQNNAARAFVNYVRQEEGVQRLLKQFGYGSPQQRERR